MINSKHLYQCQGQNYDMYTFTIKERSSKGHKTHHDVLLVMLCSYFSNMKTGDPTSLTASSLPARTV